MAYLDDLSDDELATYDPWHRYATATFGVLIVTGVGYRRLRVRGKLPRSSPRIDDDDPSMVVPVLVSIWQCRSEATRRSG